MLELQTAARKDSGVKMGKEEAHAHYDDNEALSAWATPLKGLASSSDKVGS